MRTKLVMYVDGSEVQVVGKRQKIVGRAQGWGLIAMHDDSTEEHYGHVRIRGERGKGFHEMHAFVAAVEYAEMMGYLPAETVIYTDDELVAYASFHLHQNNYSKQRTGVLRRVQEFCSIFYPSVKGYALKLFRWLCSARFHKIKGHSSCIHNNRADYLAKCGAHNKPKQCNFEAWLKTLLSAERAEWGPEFIGVNFLLAEQFTSEPNMI